MALDLATLCTPFVIVGGVATAMYMPQRLTLDVDVLVRPDDGASFADEFHRVECSPIDHRSSGRRSWQSSDGSVLDIHECTAPWADDAIRLPTRSPSGLPVIGLPYLVLMKLEASRPQDLADISRMLGAADETSLAAVRSTVDRFRPEERDDVESLIALGKLEFMDPS